MSSFTINAEREKQVNMVSYFDAGTMWAVPTGNPRGVTVEDPCGKEHRGPEGHGPGRGDRGHRQVLRQADGKAAINIQPYNLQSDATTAVVSGKSDAMLADSPVTAYAIQQSGGKLEQLGDIYGTAPYGVVVARIRPGVRRRDQRRDQRTDRRRHVPADPRQLGCRQRCHQQVSGDPRSPRADRRSDVTEDGP